MRGEGLWGLKAAAVLKLEQNNEECGGGGGKEGRREGRGRPGRSQGKGAASELCLCGSSVTLGRTRHLSERRSLQVGIRCVWYSEL